MKQSLNGNWSLQQAGKRRTYPAHVPGDVYADLLAAGEIADPFFRDNEIRLQWIGESDWTYSRQFRLTKAFVEKEILVLRCNGLDTLATIMLNGKQVAKTYNMFRSYEWNIKPFVKPGINTICIQFASVIPYIREQMKAYPAWQPFAHSAAHAGWVRKEQCNFGWDWGIRAVTCGIWKSIELIAFDVARITDVAIRQQHQRTEFGGQRTEGGKGQGGRGKGLSKAESEILKAEGEIRDSRGTVSGKRKEAGERHSKGSVGLTVQVTADKVGRSTLRANVTVSLKGKVVASEVQVFRGMQTSVDLTVFDPQLWWPNGMGARPLYDIKVELLDKAGMVLDSQTKRIGLRTIELDRHDDEWGESFQFKINGVPFFAKGANWIPVDAVLGRRSPNDYRRLIQDAASCNMNMLRVWGGGIYEDDVFYDVCDELGLCVWQDFMFACAAYPTFMDGFLDNVRAEARDAITRLRHHPSLALWCGNNELEMMNVSDSGWDAGSMPWKDYCALFDDLLPAQVKQHSPEIPYWPSSPHSPKGDRKKHRSHRSGDAHLWIMSGRYPLDCARGMEHRFASEFGFQSLPEPKTIQTFTQLEDRNVFSRIMDFHQRAPNGNEALIQQLSKCFRLPSNSDNVAWVSQILQGSGVKSACEHFRRSMPRSMGALYWQLNDSWPVASWSSIDYYGRWKALQYMARHFFAPVLISGVFDEAQKTVEVHVTSDHLKRLDAEVAWTVTDIDGGVFLEGSKNIRTPMNGSRIVKRLRLGTLLSRYSAESILVWLDLKTQGGQNEQNLLLLAPPKHMDLHANPCVGARLSRSNDGLLCVELSAKRPALWVWLELDGLDARFSDNFVHLRPGISKIILVQLDQKLTLRDMKSKMIVRSIVDTY